uniref:Uncharacterized protein n=1 Tax=viral metagenome TaxID=1070528 RepID=A0A6M3LPR2_9ZZZZ
MVKFSEKMKWYFTFTLLILTIAWAVFARYLLPNSETDIITGALISWNALVIQYYFRKKTPETTEPK